MQGDPQHVARASCPCCMGETPMPRHAGRCPARRGNMACHAIERTTSASSAGFSVLEILCVLLILSILYGFIMTAVTALRKGGEMRQARTEALALAQAVQSYRRVYGRWPGDIPAGSTNDVLIIGEAQTNVIAALLDNPRGLDLIDPPSGVVTNHLHLDPWGNPYLIAMDTSSDGHLSIGRFGIGTVRNTTAGVMSHGGDGTTNAAPIRSWEIHRAR